MQNTCAVILAAGDGKRMKSARPKVLCEVLFKPMITWVCDHVAAAGIEDACVVLGSGAEKVLAVLPEGYATVMQEERKGTGHAASMTKQYLKAGGFSHVAVLAGDAPFVTAEVLENAYWRHIMEKNEATVITARVPDPTGYGRIIRAHDGRVTAIVEEKDASEPERAVDEINSGDYWFETEALLDFFENMTNDNAQGEFYLTDALSYLLKKGGRVGAYLADAKVALGANDRESLAGLNEIARCEIIHAHRENGVDIPFSDSVIIGADVEIGADTRILPGTILRGATKIGADCEIGPNSYLDNAVVGEGSRIISSYIERAEVQNGVKIGPMSNIRPDSLIGDGVKIGDFVEIKNSVIGEKTALAHLTYIGDSDVGKGCNFGCGVVTTNYDGTNKHRTTVGDGAFVGCNVNLIPPVTVGDRAYIAAATTITKDVPAGAMAIGRAEQTVKEGWADKKGLFRK
jgi:bifunctional UDP-N-acetylglucosamine pyrophosphorylase/glucosamine-1-phosphate N-acetyltransferase